MSRKGTTPQIMVSPIIDLQQLNWLYAKLGEPLIITPHILCKYFALFSVTYTINYTNYIGMYVVRI